MSLLTPPLSKRGILKALGQDPSKSDVLTVSTNSDGGNVFDAIGVAILTDGLRPTGGDDTPMINAAIKKTYERGGGEVKLSPGTFVLKTKGTNDLANKGAIQLLDGVSLRGSGPAATIVIADVSLPKDTPIVRAMTAKRIGVAEFKIDGNRRNRPTVIADDPAEDEGVSFVDCRDVFGIGMEITDTGQEAFDCDENDGMLFSRNYIHDCWGNAFHLSGSAPFARNGEISDCVIDNVSKGRGGSVLTAASAITLMGDNMRVKNTRISNSYRGIYHSNQATNTRIEKCIFYGNVQHDIFSENMTNSGLLVSDCVISHATESYAVDLRSARAVVRNLVLTTTATTFEGIQCTNGAAGTRLENCRVTGGKNGIVVFGAGYTIDGGVFSGAVNYGVLISAAGSQARVIGATLGGTVGGLNMDEQTAVAELLMNTWTAKCRIRNAATVFVGVAPPVMEFATPGGRPATVELLGQGIALRSPNQTRYALTVSDAGVVTATAA